MEVVLFLGVLVIGGLLWRKQSTNFVQHYSTELSKDIQPQSFDSQLPNPIDTSKVSDLLDMEVFYAGSDLCDNDSIDCNGGRVDSASPEI